MAKINVDPREVKLRKILSKSEPIRFNLAVELVSVKKYFRPVKVNGEILDNECMSLQLKTSSGAQFEATLETNTAKQAIVDALLDSDQLYSIFEKHSRKPVDG